MTLAHLHQSNSRITPSTQTITELITDQVSIKVDWGKWAVFLLSKKIASLLFSISTQNGKVYYFSHVVSILLSIVDGLTPNLGISLIKVSSIFFANYIISAKFGQVSENQTHCWYFSVVWFTLGSLGSIRLSNSKKSNGPMDITTV